LKTYQKEAGNFLWWIIKDSIEGNHLDEELLIQPAGSN
jgi:hypothetical protein